MSHPDELPPMGDMLAAVEPDLIYYEAKRQFEALARVQQHDKDRATIRVTRQQSDLSLHYRNLFENCTKGLSKLQKVRLLHVCFAYKEKARVLQFLDLLDENEFDWVGALRRVVGECGRDTAFERTPLGNEYDKEGEAEKALAGDDLVSVFKTQYLAKQGSTQMLSQGNMDRSPCPQDQPPLPAFPASLVRSPFAFSPTKRTSAKQPPYFIIPTLSLAYPTAFFSALASYACISPLGVVGLLPYPAAYLIAFSPPLKRLQHENLPNFWKRSVHDGEVEGSQEAEWAAFFEHLMRSRERLITWKGSELEMEAGGYTSTDLSLWIAGWVAERQAKENAEKGLEERAKIRLSAGKVRHSTRNRKTQDSAGEGADDADASGDGDSQLLPEIAPVEDASRRGRKRLSFSDVHVEHVASIRNSPPKKSPSKKRKTTRKR